MCRAELCVVAPPHRGRALLRQGTGPPASTHSYSEGAALVHHRAGNSGPFSCRVHGTSPLPCSSLTIRPRLIVVVEFPLQNTGKTMLS